MNEVIHIVPVFNVISDPVLIFVFVFLIQDLLAWVSCHQLTEGP